MATRKKWEEREEMEPNETKCLPLCGDAFSGTPRAGDRDISALVSSAVTGDMQAPRKTTAES